MFGWVDFVVTFHGFNKVLITITLTLSFKITLENWDNVLKVEK